MPSVGVVIPCHPMHYDRVRRAVDSCPQADQVVVVLDGAHPESGPSLQVPVVKTHSLVPGGVCHARNLGISHLTTDLIIPLDADDYFLEHGINRLVEAWRPGRWVYGGYRDDLLDSKSAPPAGMILKKNIAQATMCFARSDWLEVGGYDPRYNIGAEDWAFQLELTRSDIMPSRVDAIIYHYSGGGMRSDFGDYTRVIMDMLRLDYGATPTIINRAS